MEKKLLIVDDEIAILNLLKEYFSKHGYKVITANNGKDALKEINKKNVSVFILDLEMPNMTGIELCKRIRAKIPKASIFAITGEIAFLKTIKNLDLGFNSFFTKPFDIEILFQKVERTFYI